jgi:CheY-like chemotaxis protein
MIGWVGHTSFSSLSGFGVEERFNGSVRESGENADGQIFWYLNAQWAVILCTSFWLASKWSSAGLGQLCGAAVWVGVLSAVPMWMVLQSPGTRRARYSVAVSQGLMSSLLWYVSGGKAETHLHLYTWLAVLSLYRDVPTLVVAGVAAVISHAVILSGSILPELASANSPHWFWHVIWAAGLCVETVFLSMYVALDRQSLADRLRRMSTADTLNSRLEQIVQRRTLELTRDCERLRAEVASLNNRLVTSEASQVAAAGDVVTLRDEIADRGNRIRSLANHLVGHDLPESSSTSINALLAEIQQLLELVEPRQPQRSEDATSPMPIASPTRIIAHAPVHELALVATPALVGDATPVAAPKREPRLTSSEGPASEEKRALLLVKNVFQQKRASEALKAEGYVVDFAANGPRAYYSVMLNDYAVIVVDIDLPGEEGYDTLEALHLLPPGRIRDSKCLFALTTALEPDRVLRCTDLKVDGIFVKPLKAEALRQSLAVGSSQESEDRKKWAWTGASLSR